MAEKKTRLVVEINLKRASITDRAARLALGLGAILAIPVTNVLILGNHWSINLVGAVFGFLLFGALFKSNAEIRGIM